MCVAPDRQVSGTLPTWPTRGLTVRKGRTAVREQPHRMTA